MNILICINDAFTNQAIQTLKSISLHNDTFLDVYLVYNNVSKESLEKISSFLTNEGIGSLHEIYYDFSNYNLPMNINHITRETYFRLYAPYLLPLDMKRILYLDCDIICTGSIVDFYNTDFEGNVFVGIKNYDFDPNESFNIYINNKLELPPDNIYINAGVLLMNLEEYRNYISLEELNNFINVNQDNLPYQDQDVINKLFCSHIKIDENKYDYNYQIRFTPEDQLSYDDKKLVHYLDSPKPWDENYAMPFHGVVYYRFLFQTEQCDLLNHLLLLHFKNTNLSIYQIKEILNKIY